MKLLPLPPINLEPENRELPPKTDHAPNPDSFSNKNVAFGPVPCADWEG